MSNAYAAWKQLRGRQINASDQLGVSEELLSSIEESLRPAALKDFLESHAGYDASEEPRTLTENEVWEFLRDLDELRKPSLRELDHLKNELLADAFIALRRMERLNYTDDHTHFEVLADARQVLAAVLTDKGFPPLDRFRCQSTYEAGAKVYQCTLQLPHGGDHHVPSNDTAAGASMFKNWTDAESLNPPVPYEDPKPEPAPALRQCEAERVGDRCGLLIGHEGDHSTRDGNVTWTAGEVGTCGQTRDGLGKCVKLPNHFGEHQSFTGTWSTDEAPTTRWGQ